MVGFTQRLSANWQYKQAKPDVDFASSFFNTPSTHRVKKITKRPV